jgi:hypothetical protein
LVSGTLFEMTSSRAESVLDPRPLLSIYSKTAERIVIWPRFLKFYAALHGIWFALYAFLGKGFAYAGWAPFFVSEFLLLLAIPALLASRRVLTLSSSLLGGIFICFLIWQAACFVPYLELYGLDALRDSVIWGYAVFAWVAAALVVRLPRSVEILVQRYRRFAGIYLYVGPAAWLITIYLRDWLPVWPGTSVSIPLIKGGEYGVHLAGLFAFAVQGGQGTPVWWALLILVEALLGMSNRGGLLAFLCAATFILILRPRARRLLTIAIVGLTLLLTMAALDVHFTPVGAPREVSVDVLSHSLVSVFSESERSDLEGTKAWRLNWWRHIWAYTFGGPYFWSGKGYGINLADSDGFPAGTREEPLRSPHNSHLTFLARSGVPGFLLWLLLQLTWAASMLGAHLRARRLDWPWSGIFAWLLTYWVAFVVEAGFDVSLEGPMEGIPFWTVFGLGWGALILFRSRTAETLTRGSVVAYAR